jgi:hypothetical protein
MALKLGTNSKFLENKLLLVLQTTNTQIYNKPDGLGLLKFISANKRTHPTALKQRQGRKPSCAV